MRITTTILFGSLALAALVGLGSCNKDLVCGTGTIEQDGVCISTEGTPGGNCGAGSFYDQTTGRCVTNFCNGGLCGLCDPDTTIQQPNDAGVPVCVGTGQG